MRRSLSAIILAAALWNILPAASMAADIPRPPSDAFVMAEVTAIAPDTPFALPDGTPATLADWRGKVVVLNFWATWCAPCVKELPSLDRLAAALPADSHAVLVVSTDRGGPKKVPPFLKKLKTENLAPYLDAKSALAAHSACADCQQPTSSARTATSWRNLKVLPNGIARKS